jgi:hypothetical protein
LLSDIVLSPLNADIVFPPRNAYLKISSAGLLARDYFVSNASVFVSYFEGPGLGGCLVVHCTDGGQCLKRISEEDATQLVLIYRRVQAVARVARFTPLRRRRIDFRLECEFIYWFIRIE